MSWKDLFQNRFFGFSISFGESSPKAKKKFPIRFWTSRIPTDEDLEAERIKQAVEAAQAEEPEQPVNGGE